MKRYCITLLSLIIGLNVEAIEPEAIDSLITLKDVVVTANRVQVNRNSVPLSISVIDRAEIEASSESALLPVLSQRIPGLFVTEKGITGFGVNAGSAGTVNIRGVGQSNKVLMLFDGQPQWAGLFGHSLPDTYVASDVDRVEVIRGPGSLLYGSNAMGGVVNIITRSQLKQGRRTQARVMYGSYNTQKYMLSNGYNTGRLSTFLSVNHDRTDGHRPDSKFHITNGFGKAGYRFNDHYKAIADVSLAKFKTQNPGETYKPIIDNYIDVLRGTASLAFENTFAKSSGALRAFYNWGHHNINDGYNPGSEPLDYRFKSDDRNAGLLLYQSFRLMPGNSFTLGIDYKNWGGHAWNAYLDGDTTDLIDKSINEAAGYLIAQQDLFGKLSLNAGVRYEYNSQFGGEWIPQAGLTFRPAEASTFKASMSKGFRSPNIREMFMFPPQNPDLKPESMMNYEASFAQSFLRGALSAELTAFYIEGKDMIQNIAVDGRRKNMNTGRFYNKGLEAELNYRANSRLHFNTSYSYLSVNKPIVAAPKHKYLANATYTPGRFAFNLNLQSIFGLYTYVDEAAPTNNRKEDFTTLDAKASYLFGTKEKGITVFLKGENLTASRYQINDGFPMPKAVFMGGLELTF